MEMRNVVIFYSERVIAHACIRSRLYGDRERPPTTANTSNRPSHMLFGPRMRERASDVAPNEFKSCRLPTRRVTGAEFAPHTHTHTRLNSREEKHEDRFGSTKARLANLFHGISKN